MKSQEIIPRALPPRSANYSVRQTCAWSGLSVASLYREIRAGRLEVTHIGARTLTTPENRENWKKTWVRAGAA